MEQAVGELIAILAFAMLINAAPVTGAPEQLEKGRCYEITTVLGHISLPSRNGFHPRFHERVCFGREVTR